MFKVLIPVIKSETTYYLRNGYGGVATVKGSDIHIHGHFVTDGNNTDFVVQCTYGDCGAPYSVEEVKVKSGSLLVQVERKPVTLTLSWYNRASDERINTSVTDDLELTRRVWICKDYEPKLVTMATDEALILPYNSYVYEYGEFRCDIDSGAFANDQVYRDSEDVRFYCRCHAVTDKSMAQRVRLTNEQLAELNGRIKNLVDYCDEQGITLAYDNDDGIVRAYKVNDLPEGYEADIDDHDNDNPQSITVPWSGMRKVDLDLACLNPYRLVRLNYTEPKKEDE